MPRDVVMRALREAVIAVVVTAAIACATFRPLFWDGGSLPRYVGPHAPFESADRNLNLWILTWIARALLVEPTRLFDGNIYAPAENTLAGSETMLAHVPVTAALWAALGDATWVLKSEMLWGAGGSALATYALARVAGAPVFAATLAAAAVGLEPGRINPRGTAGGVAAQPQYLGFAYAPLAMLALIAWARGRRWAGFAGVASGLALQALACFYLGYYAFVTVPLFGAALLWTRGFRESLLAVLAAGLGAALVLPVALQYLVARRAGAVRTPDAELPWLGSIAGAGLGVAGAWMGPLALALAGVAAVASVRLWLGGRSGRTGSALATIDGLGASPDHAGRESDLRLPPPGFLREQGAIRRAALAMAAGAVVLAWGPELRLGGGVVLPLPHSWLAAVIPGFAMLRGPIRALSFATLGVAVAGAIALGEIGVAWRRQRRAVCAVLGVGLAFAWVARGRVPVESAPLTADLPEVYRWLATQPPHGAVLEVPGAAAEEDLGGLVRESRYMIYSTVHWHRLVNGYTAYPPVWGELAKSLARRLPDHDALETLVELVPLRTVIVHEALLAPAERAAWDRALEQSGLALEARFGDDAVYRVTMEPGRDWRGAVAEATRSVPVRTLEGTLTSPLAPACRSARIHVEFPRMLRSSLMARRLPVRVWNDSDCSWPGLAVRPDGLVVVTASWVDAPAGSVPPRIRSRLPHDVPPKASVATDALVLTPAVPGSYRLRVELVQEGGSSPLAAAEGAVVVAPVSGSTE